MYVPPDTAAEEERGAGMRDLLRAFTAISRALNLAQPLPETLDLISEKVSRTMGHKSCAVLLANRATGELLIEGCFGLGEDYVEAVNTRLKQKIEGDGPASRSVTAQAFRTGMPVYAPDITEDPRFAPWREAALKEGYNSIVALPLTFRDEVIGVLNCYDKPREYTEDQVEALTVVAEQAASAVGIARLISSQRATIVQLNALNEHVTAQHALMRRTERTHDTLAASLLERRSLEDMTATLSDLLDAPVALQDGRWRTVSASHPEAHWGLDPSLQDPSVLGAGGRAVALDRDAKGPTVVVVPVDLGGYLSAALSGDAGETFALRTLEQAAVIFALYAARQQAQKEAENRVRGDLVSDLLAGRFRDEDEARERALGVGLNLSAAPSRIIVFRHEPLPDYLARKNLPPKAAGSLRSRLLSLSRSVAENADPPGLAGPDGDRLVAIVPSPPGTDAGGQARRLVRLAREGVPDLRVRAAVSAPCAGPADLCARREEAESLLDLAERLRAEADVLCHEDWKVYGLVLRGNDRDGLLELAHRTLDPLLALGPDASADLLSTLQAYLENDLSPTRAAAALHVHPNTVKYRLGKVADLVSLDPSNLDDILTLKISLMVRSLAPEGFDARSHP